MKISVLSSLFLLLALGCAPSPGKTTAPVESSMPREGTVLFVLSAADTQTLADGTQRQTGFFLNEFFEPYEHVTSLGYEVVIATPQGAPAVVDPESYELEYWRDEEALEHARSGLSQIGNYSEPISLGDALERIDEFSALIVPGGQGVMMDLYGNQTMHELLLEMGARRRPVGLICHAPALLLGLPEGNAFEGMRVTSVSRLEELYIERIVMGGAARDRLLGKQLDVRYAHHSGLPKADHAERDCHLVTSQNPFSGEAFAIAFEEALQAYEAGEPCKTF